MKNIGFRSIQLCFAEFVPVNTDLGLVPFYHFKILDEVRREVGHINFRVGETRHVRLTAGHVGYSILPEYRGDSYSYHACLALVPFIKRRYSRIILTTDPGNAPSIRIIEKLGASFIDEIEVPMDDPAYPNGARRKRRYEWSVLSLNHRLPLPSAPRRAKYSA